MCASPLRLAIRNRDVDLVRRLLLASPATAREIVGGLSHLYVAACWNLPEIGLLLFDANCDVDAPSSEGITPLLIALKCGHRTFAKMLIARGAKVSAASRSGESPLSHVMQNNDEEILHHMMMCGSVSEPVLAKDASLVTRCNGSVGMQFSLKPGSSVTVFSPHRECVCWISI